MADPEERPWDDVAETPDGAAPEVGPDEPDDHDPTGIDVAQRIAHQIVGSGAMGAGLPAPRGVSARKRRQRPAQQGPQRSGAGPDERDPQPLGSALSRMIDERGWTREISVRTLLVRWPELVGAANAEHSRPESYADGVLTIRTESTAWATSLRQLARPLVAELNRRLGDGTVTRVVVVGPTAPSWKKGPRSVPGRGPRDTYG